MNWYYESDGKPQGPVSGTELNRLIAEGKVTNRTLVWSKGMIDWQPLHAVFSETSEQSPDRKPLAEEAKTPSTPLNQSSAPSHDDDAPPMPSWENQAAMGWIQAFFNTLAEVLTDTSTTFPRLPKAFFWGPSIRFYILCGILGSIFWTLTMRIAPPRELPFLFPGVNSPNHQAPFILTIVFSLIGIFVFLPLQAILGTAILHGSLWVTGGAKKRIETTFRVITYVLGAGSVLWFMPLSVAMLASLSRDPAATQAAVSLASLVVSFWTFVTLGKATAAAHGIGLVRGFISLILPAVLCCGLSTALLVWLGIQFSN